MLINREVIEHVAKLARLKLEEDNIEELTQKVNNILAFVDKLNEIDTGKIPPTAHILPLQNVFREDEIKPSLPLEDVLKNAPEAEQGCFHVPKVIEG